MTTMLRPSAVAIALAVTLVVFFSFSAQSPRSSCRRPPLSHAWIGLFATAPVGSGRAWIEGIVASVVLGVVGGYIFAATYNALGSRT